jgi:8-oxo-dGTP diphosphatase
MRREYPDGPVAAVGVVVRMGDRVLLVQRGKEPGKGRWSIPGGAVEAGETLREAGRREVAEECGIDVQVGGLAGVFETIIPGDDGRTRYHYIMIDFFADYLSGDLQPASDVMDVRWSSRADLDTLDITEKARDLLARVLDQQEPTPI